MPDTITLSKDVSRAELDTLISDDHNETPPIDIVSYNELRSCADFFRMYEKGSLDLKPEFQRDIVWPQSAQSRFIDSLIKELPIPSLCFAYEAKIGKWTVIDGLQRLFTIINFLKGDNWKISNIEDIEPNIAGKTAHEIKTAKNGLEKYYERIENLTIPVTVIRCDMSDLTHLEYVFTIFHRLNTGGMKLNNQEIRNCVSSGTFNKLLHELDKTPKWRKMNKMTPEKKYRYAKQEIMLRLFAFNANYKTYDGKLSKFLNEYMHVNRNPSEAFLESKEKIFKKTVEIVGEKVLEQPYSKLPISIFEALLVGVSKNLPALEVENKTQLRRRYKMMLKDKSFSETELKEGLSQKSKVISRMDAAVKAFS